MPTLAVVGAGAMGGQIAYQAALHGYDARLISRSEDRLRWPARLAALLRRRVEKGTLEGDACDAALARVALGSDFAAVAGAEVIIESVAEDRDIKCEVYARSARMPLIPPSLARTRQPCPRRCSVMR